jgi:hypothetical protein
MPTPKAIWIGMIPDIFGYGINVASDSKANAMAALRKAYDDHKKHNPNPNTNFDDSFEYWGGSVIKVTLNKPYSDNFNS